MSTENCVTAFTHAGGVGKLIGQAQVLQGADNSHEFTHADSLNPSVDLAGFVTDADGHCVATAIANISLSLARGFFPSISFVSMVSFRVVTWANLPTS